MELSQIRYFLYAANLRHITKAAEELHIAQPALTKSIHKLEDELGVPLFKKTGRGVDLTDYGVYLKDELSKIISQIDAIPAKISEMKDTNKKTIHIRVAAASIIVTEAIIEYSKLNPDIIFNVSQNGDGVEEDIFVYSTMPGSNTDGSLAFRERIFVAIPNDMEKYRSISSVQLSDIASESFICLMGSRQLRSISDNYCAMAGFTPKIIFESDNLSSVRNMIAARVGIGFWPEFSWNGTGIDTSGLHFLEITSPSPSRDIHLSYVKKEIHSEAAENFFEFLKDYFAKCFTVNSGK